MTKKRLFCLFSALIMSACLAAVMTVSTSASTHSFTDVPEWADGYVDSVYKKGIMRGITDSLFDSDGELTREQLVVTLYRLSGSRHLADMESLKECFADADDISEWAYDAVWWAYSESITTGIRLGEDIYFKPQSHVTRQEAAKFIVTYIDYMELVPSTDNTAELLDMDKVAGWALPYVERCVAAGIINGNGSGNFDPTGVTVRVATAKMVSCIPTRKNSKMIAHRGYSCAERENTIPAFIAAGERSYYGIEADIWATADNEFAVIHNQTTTAVTEGAYNLDVTVSTWEELSEVRIPDLDGSFDRDIRLPRVEDYIAICKQYKKVPILELKGKYTTEQLELLIRKIASLGYLEDTTFISFSWNICVELRRLLPENDIYWLTEADFKTSIIDALLEHNINLSINHNRFYQPNVEQVRLSGLKFAVWTCDDPEKAEKYREWGVDFITTNCLE